MTKEVLEEVLNERKKQDHLWGPEHDDKHSTAEFLNFIQEYSSRCEQESCDEEARKRLIQIAALAIAAVESFDRRPKIPEVLYIQDTKENYFSLLTSIGHIDLPGLRNAIFSIGGDKCSVRYCNSDRKVLWELSGKEFIKICKNIKISHQ